MSGGIALDAGMRPMLIRHGFTRKTKRYYVRETENSVQVVPIHAGTRHGYRGGAGFCDCGNVSIKELDKLGEELQLGYLHPKYRHTDHDCHMTCDLSDYDSFFNVAPFRREMRKKHFIRWMFIGAPSEEESIPEVLALRELYSKFEDSIDRPESVPLIEDYGRARSDTFEKYIIPWFDKCDDISFAVQWIEERGGRGNKTGCLLLAAASCLAGDFEKARPELLKAIAEAKKSRRDHYNWVRRPRIPFFGSYRDRSKRYANKFADFAYRYYQEHGRKARALADRFGIRIE